MATLIEKAVGVVAKASRGTLSGYVLNAPHEYGQPITQQVPGDVQGLITPERMREIVMKTPTAGSAMNAVLDYVGGVRIDVRYVDASKPAQGPRIEAARQYLRIPNPQDTERRFRAKLHRDLFTLGYAAIEIEAGAITGKPANLWTLDAGRLRVDFDQHGTILGYNMLDAHGYPITQNGTPWAWRPDQVIFFSLNPMSESLYPYSRIQQLFTLAVVEDLMVNFIGGRFTESNVPFGVMGIGDVNEQELQAAISYWNAQAHDKHRIVMTGSRGNLQFIPFSDRLKDLEAKNLLETIRGDIMGIVGVTMNELGESQDINKSNGYNLSYTFKKRAVEPPLQEFCETLTRRLLWDSLGWKDMEFYYEEIDSRDELLQSQIDDSYSKAGIWSINHIRNRKGLPNIPGGDEPAIFTGSAWIPVKMLPEFAQAQLDALQATVKETQVATQQAQQAMKQAAQAAAAGQPPQPGATLKPQISPPLVRPAQLPEKYTTPDGSGSSTAKVKLMKPQVKPPKGATSGAPQKPRGPVQASRNAGQRKEDS